MMYVGTSLGRCLQSLLLGKVSKDDVLVIITRTKSETLEQFIGIVKQYHEGGNFTSSRPAEYDLAVKPWEDVEKLATDLYNGGKIHQPRNFVGLGRSFYHPDLNSWDNKNEIWMEVSPTNRNTTPAVVNAYKEYRMLDELTK
jgi:hypothetical protein